jgi:hypothetical protein
VKLSYEEIDATGLIVIDDIVIELNAEVQEREQADGIFDFKRELKSPKAVRALSARVIAAYARLVARARVPSFGTEWDQSRKLKPAKLDQVEAA